MEKNRSLIARVACAAVAPLPYVIASFIDLVLAISSSNDPRLIVPHFRGETRGTLSVCFTCDLGRPVQVQVRGDGCGSQRTGGTTGRLRGGATGVQERGGPEGGGR